MSSGWTNQIFKWLGYARFKVAPVAVGDGQVVELLADAFGRLRTVVEGPTPAAYSRSVGQASGVAKASAGQLLELWCSSLDSGSGYLLLFDAAAVPPSGTVPLEVFPLGPGESLAFSPSAPLPFSTGLSWAISTDPATYDPPVSGGEVAITVAVR